MSPVDFASGVAFGVAATGACWWGAHWAYQEALLILSLSGGVFTLKNGTKACLIREARHQTLIEAEAISRKRLVKAKYVSFLECEIKDMRSQLKQANVSAFQALADLAESKS